MRPSALVLVAALCSGGVVSATREAIPCEITAAAYRVKSAECELVAKRSKGGDTSATLLFARSLEFGTCGTRNPREAAVLYRLVAEKGNSNAAFFLGMLYHLGANNFPRDDKEAAKWLSLSAEEGNADAQFALGTLYRAGLGVPGSASEAATWFERAAKKGHISAQAALGASYFAGTGVPEDTIDAYLWWSLAARSGDESAKLGLKSLVTRMSKQQLDKGKKLVTDWRKNQEAVKGATPWTKCKE